MKNYKVEFNVIEYIEAEDEDDAQSEMCRIIREMRTGELYENMEISEEEPE